MGKSHGRQDALDPGQAAQRLGMSPGVEPGAHRLLDICDSGFNFGQSLAKYLQVKENLAQVPQDGALGTNKRVGYQRKDS